MTLFCLEGGRFAPYIVDCFLTLPAKCLKYSIINYGGLCDEKYYSKNHLSR
jgi:hypothetical protein